MLNYPYGILSYEKKNKNIFGFVQGASGRQGAFRTGSVP